MNDELTKTTGFGQPQRTLGPKEREEVPAQQAYAQAANTAEAVRCPQCGTINSPEAMFCATCGAMLKMATCPNCGSPLDPDADFCETCHSYIRHDVCSFCGTHLDEHEAFCHECGSPRGGIVCPVCHTLNEFSFCKQCGAALTDEARQLMAEMKATPQYKELLRAAEEFNDLEMQVPYLSDRDLLHEKSCEQLRERVLRLLAEDEGLEQIIIPPSQKSLVSKEELDARKAEIRAKITELLNRIATPPQIQPVKARNYAMAQKPAGMRLAWQCNYKNALHSSPCGCAKPQLGGRWVVLGNGTKQEIKDDL